MIARRPLLTDERKALIAGVAIPTATAVLTLIATVWVVVALVWGSAELIAWIGDR